MIPSLASLFLCYALAAPPQIDVVYPRLSPGDKEIYIARVDSNFIFGSVQPPSAGLFINGAPVILTVDGAFLAWLPVDWQRRRYDLVASDSSDTARMTVTFNEPPPSEPPTRPAVSFPLMLKLRGGYLRNDPKGAYYLFPLPGTWVEAVEWKDGYYRVPLTPQRSVWAPEWYATVEPNAVQIGFPVVWKASVTNPGKWDRVRTPLDSAPLYRVDHPDDRTLTLDLFGVISHLDKVSYSTDLQAVREIRWEQPEDRVMRLVIKLNRTLWGYRVDYKDGVLTLDVRCSPSDVHGVKGLTIALDAGHGGTQCGAIGPTRLTEKDINLTVSYAVAEYLTEKGADVVLTRPDDFDLGLNERIVRAEAAGADLLISLHHNALPDGVNPFGAFGTGTYYYQPFSRELAWAVQREVARELGFPDEGVYYNNLALARPTAFPAILIESAYNILPEQEAVLKSPEYPQRLARAIHRGVSDFMESVER